MGASAGRLRPGEVVCCGCMATVGELSPLDEPSSAQRAWPEEDPEHEGPCRWRLELLEVCRGTDSEQDFESPRGRDKVEEWKFLLMAYAACTLEEQEISVTLLEVRAKSLRLIFAPRPQASSSHSAGAPQKPLAVKSESNGVVGREAPLRRLGSSPAVASVASSRSPGKPLQGNRGPTDEGSNSGRRILSSPKQESGGVHLRPLRRLRRTALRSQPHPRRRRRLPCVAPGLCNPWRLQVAREVNGNRRRR